MVEAGPYGPQSPPGKRREDKEHDPCRGVNYSHGMGGGEWGVDIYRVEEKREEKKQVDARCE